MNNNKLSKSVKRKVQVTNVDERKKIFVVGIILIAAILVGGFLLGQYGAYVENKITNSANSANTESSSNSASASSSNSASVE